MSFYTYRDGRRWEWHRSVLGAALVVRASGYQITMPPEDEGIARVIAEAEALRDSLRDLVDWAREHTSPSDLHSPHQILCTAMDVLNRAEG